MSAQQTPAKYPVVGVCVSVTDYQQVVSTVREWVAAPLPEGARYVCVTTANGIITAHRDPSFRMVLNDADIVTPDGMPLVWALRSFGFAGRQRVYGPTLTVLLCEQAARLGHRVFFYGGRPEVLEALTARMRQHLPELQIAGAFSPPFRALTPAGDDEHVRMVLESGADLLFVGLGEPKQERWMASHRERLPGIVMLGVGAAFDFHAGTLRQAPVWMQNAGLEWLFRLWMEPARLWRRYLLTTPLFIPLWALQKLGFLRYSAQTEPGY